jgi:hypothetical protein
MQNLYLKKEEHEYLEGEAMEVGSGKREAGGEYKQSTFYVHIKRLSMKIIKKL